ncbi:hypothetical protein ACLKA7_003754 [Drosophila subpalustris]
MGTSTNPTKFRINFAPHQKEKHKQTRQKAAFTISLPVVLPMIEMMRQKHRQKLHLEALHLAWRLMMRDGRQPSDGRLQGTDDDLLRLEEPLERRVIYIAHQ